MRRQPEAPGVCIPVGPVAITDTCRGVRAWFPAWKLGRLCRVVNTREPPPSEFGLGRGFPWTHPFVWLPTLPSQQRDFLINHSYTDPPLDQGIFPTQGSNLGLPHCRRILYHLSTLLPWDTKSLCVRVRGREGGFSLFPMGGGAVHGPGLLS